MADVQVENGFTKIANQILEEIAKFKFNGTELRIIMIIWRYTYGFNRKSHEMSAGFISNAIGVDISRVKKVLKDLIDKKVILVVEEASFNSSRILAFNKNFEEWGVENDTRGKKVPQVSERTLPQGSNSTPPQGSKITPKKENIKEIYKENKEEEEKDPAKFFDKYIAPISPVIVQQIEDWENDLSPEIVIRAMKEAVYQNARNWKYINRILRDWYNKGAKSLNDVERLIKEFELQKNKKIARFQPRAVGSTYDPSKDRF